MASPPTVAAAAAVVDPKRPGQYTLKIGRGLKSGTASASASASSYSGVKYNHKPNLSHGSRKTKLAHNSDGGASLSIRDDEDGKTSRYAYKGSKSTSKGSYVLIFNPETQSCTLEPVKSTYNFNLTSTPWETSKEKLTRQYDQLGTKEAAQAGTRDEDPDGEPDADNPYDFRHFLNVNGRPQSPSPSPALRPTASGGVHTPTLSSSRPSAPASASKPQSRPASKVDPLRPAPRKQKANIAESKPQPKPTPAVRLERRASARPGDASVTKSSKPAAKPSTKSTIKSDYYVHSSDDEDSPPLPAPQDKNIDAEENGGLEIDWGNDRPKPRRPPPQSSSRTLDLPDLGGDGPISLHSAANSPAGRMAIPRAKQKKRRDYEADVIDFGTSDAYISDDGDDNTQQQEEEHQHNDDDHDGDTHMRDHSDDDGDGDVEPMDLGSPAHHQPQQPPPTQQQQRDVVVPDHAPEDEVDYDDDDLEAQMMAALENEDDVEQPLAPADDESDVSEAE